jgi:uncharacterized repeat protein (TIGR03803 family)
MPRQEFSITLGRAFVLVAAVAILLFTFSALALAQAESLVHSFISLPHGAVPQSTLVADAAGNLYGTTYYGGSYNSGTVFKLAMGSNGSWRETVLHSFGGSDGYSPAAGVILDAAGNLYGTTLYGGPNLSALQSSGVVFKLSPGANGVWTETILHAFSGYFGGVGDGAGPMAGLIFDSAGNLYGTTQRGGTSDYGTVFELSPGTQGTWTETVLYHFTDSADGAMPVAGVVFDKAGNIYGTASEGGDPNCNPSYGNGGPVGCGTIFELTSNANATWSETVLHTFTGPDGMFPLANVILDSAGNLYGTTENGPGLNCFIGCGTVFKMTSSSGGNWTFNTVYVFAGGPDGAFPFGGLIQGADGHFYGTTQQGGNTANCGYGCGTAFELTPTSGAVWKEKIIHNFSGTATSYGIAGSEPMAALWFDQAGNLYGTTSSGGSQGASCSFAGCGSVFKLSKNATGQWGTRMLYSFPPSNDGQGPSSGLVADGSGNFYGMTSFGGAHGAGAVYQVSPQGSGWKERVIHSFSSIPDGLEPLGNLVVDTAGNIYGTSYLGGGPGCVNNTSGDCGLVFKLSPGPNNTWTETILYSFLGGSDGAYPAAGLTMDSAGSLYGTTTAGGTATCGCGTVFKLTPSGSGWTESVIYSFRGGLDGALPQSNLILDSAGNLYGATGSGGGSGCGGSGCTTLCFSSGCGTVFELSPQSGGAWTETILALFSKGATGWGPTAIVFGPKGEIFGTTWAGGDVTNCPNYGCGTVFKLIPSSTGHWPRRVLYTFTGGADGAEPFSSPILDSSGNLYGTVRNGGDAACSPFGSPPYGCGVVYKLTYSAGTYTESVLHTFQAQLGDGAWPYAAPLFDSLGNLFGTTNGGGNGYGAVFKINPTAAPKLTQPGTAPTRSFRPPPKEALLPGSGGFSAKSGSSTTRKAGN